MPPVESIRFVPKFVRIQLGCGLATRTLTAQLSNWIQLGYTRMRGVCETLTGYGIDFTWR
ncbi:MAG: hypothetical protein GY696_08290 [Gammaproteobacteria bacterium]|nr:hypothetical protein [Gammaproteobacteria bacterium]